MILSLVFVSIASAAYIFLNHILIILPWTSNKNKTISIDPALYKQKILLLRVPISKNLCEFYV